MRAMKTFTRRSALLALVLALSPVGHVRANHLDDTGQDAVFNPTFTGPAASNTDLSRPAVLIERQADHESPVIEFTYKLPKEWRFAFRSLRPGEKTVPEGDPPQLAETCTDVMDDLGRSGQVPAKMNRAEIIGWPLAYGRTETSRNQTVNTQRVDLSASGGPGRAGDTPTVTWGNMFAAGQPGDNRLGFLRWHEETLTADLCLYLYSSDGRLDELQANGRFNYSARSHLMPGTMSLTPEGWVLRFEIRPLFTHPFLRREHLSILDFTMYLGDFSSGTWNEDPIPFSRTPLNTGNYVSTGTYTTCDLDVAAGGAPCRAGTVRSVTRSQILRIADPNEVTHPFGVLTSPTGFQVIRGTGEVRFAWTQPVPPFGDTIKGYILTVARPGDQATRAFRYEVTDPAARLSAGQPWQSNPCGPSGDAQECSVTLQFPMTVGSGRFLDVDGKYAASLVTVYIDGHRTDGRCDDSTGPGSECPGGQSFAIAPPGISVVEFLLRERAWPLVFFDQGASKPGGVPEPPAALKEYVDRIGGAGPVVLLVDFAIQRAEIVIWNPNTSQDVVFQVPSNTIIGTNEVGGIVHLAGSRVFGPSFLFDGAVVLTPTRALANGMLITYDGRGLPGVPNGIPDWHVIPFNGTRV